MAASFYFYDLETSGFDARRARIMQFAGQRTDMSLRPLGEPHNMLIKLTDDIVPDPDAVLVTGITPQMTLSDGVTEAEFLQLFWEEIATPDTIFVGFNSVRFDDEFMRFLLYRNFYDAYEWQWQDGRSRWDMLDVVRMTRALRPDGIEWPFATDGSPTNRLELLTALNKLDHESAHDALSDVQATIAVARLIYNKQTQLFDYLLKMRSKKEVAALVTAKRPFVYTSGKYPSEFEKTTVAVMLAEHPKKQGVLVYDLRHDPSPLFEASPAELAAAWRRRRDEEGLRLPVKTLQFNRCPAVAPLGVLDKDPSVYKRLSLDMTKLKANHQQLQKHKDFAEKLLAAIAILDQEQQARLLSDEVEVDTQLYDGFISDQDKVTMSAVRAAAPEEIGGFADNLRDPRLKALLPLYKARNFPKSLNDDERAAWEAYRHRRLLGQKDKSPLHRYFTRLSELAEQAHLTSHQRYLLEELQLYGQSIAPELEA